MTILKALKDRIRSMGGETNATNIADAIKDLPSSGPSELPPEVTNAVETHGLGYTTEEPVPAINITWDGDTEGREAVLDDQYFKVSDEPISKENIVGATVSFVEESDTESIIITGDNIRTEGNFPLYAIKLENHTPLIYVISENLVISDEEFHKGVYFFGGAEYGTYVSSLTKEASTEEVAHQIDEKYIPSSVVVNFVVNLNETLESASHTPLEVCELAKTHTVLGTVMLDGYEEKYPLGALVCLHGKIGFGIDYQSADGKITNMFLNFSTSKDPDEEDTWDFTRGRLM